MHKMHRGRCTTSAPALLFGWMGMGALLMANSPLKEGASMQIKFAGYTNSTVLFTKTKYFK